MTVQSVTSSQQSSQISSKKWKTQTRDTGYAAAVLGIGSGIAGRSKKIKLHKSLAYLAGIFMIWHIGIIEYYKHIKTNKNQSQNK